MSVKNTLLSEFFSEALVILVKKLVNLFHDLLHNIPLDKRKDDRVDRAKRLSARLKEYEEILDLKGAQWHITERIWRCRPG